MKTVILAGEGRGSLAEIGGKPFIWHLVQLYSAFELNEFVIALGQNGEKLKEYFLNYQTVAHDVSLDLVTGERYVHQGRHPSWRLHLVDTGKETASGGRLKRLKRWIGSEPFMMTSGNALIDLDIEALYTFHNSHNKLVTTVAVRPLAPLGALNIKSGAVLDFSDTTQTKEGWINSGFYLIEPEVLNYIEGDDTSWEEYPMGRLAQDGEVMAFQSEGFYGPAETDRDLCRLERLWQEGKAPWMMHPVHS